MRRAALAALFCLAALPAVASAQTAPAPAAQPSAASTTPATTTAAAAPDSDANKQICKTHVPAGTRFATKECHTKAEWTAMAAQAQQDMADGSHPSMNGPK